MKLIVTDIQALREVLASASAQISYSIPLPGVVTEAQLIDCIASLENAADTRKPDSMAQVSPRALVHAIAVLKAVAK